MTQLQDPLTLLTGLAQSALAGGNGALQQLTSGLTQASTQLLSTLARGPLALLQPGAAGIPGLPGGLALPGLPTPQQLIPVQAIQGLAQLEQAALPPGLPRVSQLLMAMVGAAPPVVTPPANGPAAAGAPPQLLPLSADEVVPSSIRRRTLGLEGVNGVRPRTAARGRDARS